MDLSFFYALVPLNVSFLDADPANLLSQFIDGVQSAFSPENLTGTLIVLGAVIALIAIAFPIIRMLLRMCSRLWQAVLVIIAMIWIGSVITNGIAYSATITGLFGDINVGVSNDMIGQIAIIAGVLIAYFTTPKKLRMF